ncbi:hypothetical protein CDN99_27555 [Roseateles aquatilis]|uniref:Peptidase S8/S53 domain-containing protein n=1 Tax=Roseateles aquatilis TaxID=431061 RepID=A0A246IS29_9BURK|nr:S8 family serine peptidase [Roseateles aquatilis]OWQ82970.1 hypothetical protein CDN99_27555 [Roseateles aquatilis]
MGNVGLAGRARMWDVAVTVAASIVLALGIGGAARAADPSSDVSDRAERSEASSDGTSEGTAVPTTGAASSTALSPDARYVILAVEDRGEALSGAGGSPRGDYRRMAGYAGSARAEAISEALAHEYRLRQRAAWTIAPLNLRCMLFALSPGDEVEPLLTRLRGDARVRLAQPLNEFEALSAMPAAGAAVAPAVSPPSPTSPYNDPYFGLQKGFQQMSAAALQQVSVGSRVKVAIIDTGVDARHPDLAGQVTGQRDYVDGGGALVDGVPERHGTEILGLIAARANNRQGIVGVAPGAVVTSYRACWSDVHTDRSRPPTARCNSFTLAQALGAAIADGADVINLSLGGPSDPLLTLLARRAQSRGAVLVAAAPPERVGAGFPSDVPGALVVASTGAVADKNGWLAAPGQAVLTTVPGGGYDIDSGSSLAAAHVTGVVALLRAATPGVDASRLKRVLLESMTPSGAINACEAARKLGVSGVRCDADVTGAPSPR